MSKVIVVEGVDYAGKSTAVKAMKAYLESKGREVHVFGEPGSTDLGKQLKGIMVDPNVSMSNTTRLFLLTTARNELLTSVLPPLLEKENTVIILDRYIPSFFAYAEKEDWVFMQNLIALHPKITIDAVLYFSITEETFRRRIFNSVRETKIDGIERRLLDNFTEYTRRYTDIFKIGKYSVTEIDANKDPDTVIATALSVIKDVT